MKFSRGLDPFFLSSPRRFDATSQRAVPVSVMLVILATNVHSSPLSADLTESTNSVTWSSSPIGDVPIGEVVDNSLEHDLVELQSIEVDDVFRCLEQIDSDAFNKIAHELHLDHRPNRLRRNAGTCGTFAIFQALAFLVSALVSSARVINLVNSNNNNNNNSNNNTNTNTNMNMNMNTRRRRRRDAADGQPVHLHVDHVNEPSPVAETESKDDQKGETNTLTEEIFKNLQENMENFQLPGLPSLGQIRVAGLPSLGEIRNAVLVPAVRRNDSPWNAGNQENNAEDKEKSRDHVRDSSRAREKKNFFQLPNPFLFPVKNLPNLGDIITRTSKVLRLDRIDPLNRNSPPVNNRLKPDPEVRGADKPGSDPQESAGPATESARQKSETVEERSNRGRQPILAASDSGPSIGPDNSQSDVDAFLDRDFVSFADFKDQLDGFLNQTESEEQKSERMNSIREEIKRRLNNWRNAEESEMSKTTDPLADLPASDKAGSADNTTRSAVIGEARPEEERRKDSTPPFPINLLMMPFKSAPADPFHSLVKRLRIPILTEISEDLTKVSGLIQNSSSSLLDLSMDGQDLSARRDQVVAELDTLHLTNRVRNASDHLRKFRLPGLPSINELLNLRLRVEVAEDEDDKNDVPDSSGRALLSPSNDDKVSGRTDSEDVNVGLEALEDLVKAAQTDLKEDELSRHLNIDLDEGDKGDNSLQSGGRKLDDEDPHDDDGGNEEDNTKEEEEDTELLSVVFNLINNGVEKLRSSILGATVGSGETSLLQSGFNPEHFVKNISSTVFGGFEALPRMDAVPDMAANIHVVARLLPKLMPYVVEHYKDQMAGFVVGTKLSQEQLFSLHSSLLDWHYRIESFEKETKIEELARILKRLRENNLVLMSLVLRLMVEAGKGGEVELTRHHLSVLDKHILKPGDLFPGISNIFSGSR